MTGSIDDPESEGKVLAEPLHVSRSLWAILVKFADGEVVDIGPSRTQRTNSTPNAIE
jgi:hypothetical protein